MLDLFNDPLRLTKIAAVFLHAHGLAHALAGAQILTQALGVVANQVIRTIQNMRVAAVIFFQLDLLLHRKFAHKICHIAHARAAKGIDALIVIAHRHHAGHIGIASLILIAASAHLLCAPACKHLEPRILQFIGVLKLIDQNMLEAPRVMLANRRVVAQQFIGAQHQFAKIHHAFALALLFIQRVKLRFLLRLVITRFDIAGAQAIFFGAADEILQLLGWKALVIDVVLLA